MCKSMARRGSTVALRRSDVTRGYSSGKSEVEMWTLPRIVVSQLGQGFTSDVSFFTKSKFEGQYVKASELMAMMGRWSL